MRVPDGFGGFPRAKTGTGTPRVRFVLLTRRPHRYGNYRLHRTLWASQSPFSQPADCVMDPCLMVNLLLPILSLTILGCFHPTPREPGRDSLRGVGWGDVWADIEYVSCSNDKTEELDRP